MFNTLFERLEKSGLDIYAAEIIHDGETVLHKCFNGNIRRPVYSITKSVTSTAFSLACDDGLLSPDARLSDFMESRYKPLMSDDFIKLSFHRFLTMTAGRFPFRPSGENWCKSILSLDTDHTDDSFHYSNIPAYLVGVAVENAAGGDLSSYLNKRLWEPLGISPPPFQTSPEGHFYGATGMELTVNELALLGKFYLDSGSINGKQIISKAAMNRLVTPFVKTNENDSYGYFFRVADDHFSMSGKWGQRCMVYPEKKLVAAYLSHQPERSKELCDVFEDCLSDLQIEI